MVRAQQIGSGKIGSLARGDRPNPRHPPRCCFDRSLN